MSVEAATAVARAMLYALPFALAYGALCALAMRRVMRG